MLVLTAQHNQTSFCSGSPHVLALKVGKPSMRQEGACPGGLLLEVLQKLRLTSGRAGLGFFSARRPVLLLQWGQWSCSAGWGEMGRKVKFSKT